MRSVVPLPRRTAAVEFFSLPEIRAAVTADRVDQVLAELGATGSYRHTTDELLIGARLAWRNHARCVGRRYWATLQVLDAREAATGPEIAAACWRHLRASTNHGAIRPLITVFAPATLDGRGISIRNSQLIRYAGYRTPGTIVGDPANVELTAQAEQLGWHGAGTSFDVLPLIVDLPDGTVHVEELPADCLLEVPIEHPEFDFVAGLGLRWYATPAVSSTTLEFGGLTYPAAPFSGWYVNTEVAARNLADRDRYDMLPAIADGLGLGLGLGLDTSTPRSLWRDRALVELNRAVLHSYRKAAVRMVDHHTVAAHFIEHIALETAAGRDVPADWSWINPPISACATPTFHRYYDPPDGDRRPNFVQRPTRAAPAAPSATRQNPDR